MSALAVGTPLDVRRFPRMQQYGNGVIDGPELVGNIRPAVNELGRRYTITPNMSGGFAVANPFDTQSWNEWNSPHGFVWLVGSWGPDGPRCVANAVRMLRPLLRYVTDAGFMGAVGCGQVSPSTLWMRRNAPECFQDPVDSEVDGEFPWGDIGCGGALLFPGTREITVSFSGQHQRANPTIAAMVGGFVDDWLDNNDYPEG